MSRVVRLLTTFLAAVLIVAVGGPAARAATPKDTIVVAMGGDYFDGIDPAKSGFFISNEFQILTHERLVDYAITTLPDGRQIADTQRPIGGLAEAITVSPDKKTITMRLRKGRKFSNGDELTAHAVKFSFARGLEIPGTTRFGLTKMLRIERPEQMVVVDDHTIRFDLKAPNPIFVLTLTLNNFGIVNPREVEAHKTDKDPHAQEWMKTNSTGSGPYRLESWKPGTELVFRANPHWHGGKPAVERVIYRVVPSEQDRVLLLRNGDVDVAYNISERNAVQLKGQKGVAVTSYETVGKEFLFINPKTRPFSDRRVRQAILHAVNRDVVIKNVYMGLALPFTSPFPRGMAFHQDQPPYAHDPDRAKKLLAEAGFAGGFPVDLVYRIGSPAHEEAAVYVQADLAKIGVTAKPEKMAPATFTERVRKDEVPLGFSNFIPFVNHPAYYTYWQYHGESGYNYSRYDNPRVNELITRGQTEVDEHAQRDIYSQVQKLVHEDAIEILLAQFFFNVVTRDSVKGYVFYPDRLARWHLVRKE